MMRELANSFYINIRQIDRRFVGWDGIDIGLTKGKSSLFRAL